MGLFDIFRVGKLKADLKKVTKERDQLKAAMSVVERMEAYGLKRAIDALILKKKRATDEAEKEEAGAAEKRKALNQQIADLNQTISLKQQSILTLDDEILLQSFGFYQPKYDLASSELYKARLDRVRAQQGEMIKSGAAVHSSTSWTVNNSAKEGARMIKDYVKLILRSFNNECDASMVNVKFNNVASIEKKIRAAFDALNKLGATMTISISQQYLSLKMQELYLVYEYEGKKQEEKEEQPRIREQMREEAKLLKEIEDAKLKLEKEEKHFVRALSTIDEQLQRATTDTERKVLIDEKAKIELKLGEVTQSMLTVKKREQNTRAGYVYVISNIGSFGEHVYKIGVTRRLDPQERVDELGDASVPFEFDVHAMIFSEDAPALENALHRAFEIHRLNMINRRREFFHVSLDQIEHVVKTNFSKPVEFIRVAQAAQYRKSLALKRDGIARSFAANVAIN